MCPTSPSSGALTSHAHPLVRAGPYAREAPLDRSREHPRGREELDLNALSRRDVSLVGWDDRERVRAQHRREDMRGLLLGRSRVPAVVAHLQAHADEVGSAWPLEVGSVEHGGGAMAPGFGAGPRPPPGGGPEGARDRTRHPGA